VNVRTSRAAVSWRRSVMPSRLPGRPPVAGRLRPWRPVWPGG